MVRSARTLAMRALLTLAPLLYFVAACTHSDAGNRAAPPPPTGYERLDLNVVSGDLVTQVSPLSLRKVRFITLGDSDSAPARVQDVLVIGDSIFVLDDFAKRVRVYDRHGRPLLTFGNDGHGLDGFADPWSLASSGDRVLVLNMRRTRPVQIWDRHGTYVGTHAIVRWASPTGMVAVGNTVVLSTFTPAKVDGHEFLVFIADSAGVLVGHGCLRDSRYAVSASHQGILPMFSPSTLTTDGRRIYCTQPASAVVQELDLRGNLVGVMRRTPPFYRAPTDAPNSMNPKMIYRFLSTWTGLRKFYPRPGGFISLYSTADSTKDLYKIFACDSSRGPIRCSAGDSPGRLVAVLPGDTMVVLEPPRAGSALPQLGLYTGWR